MLNFELPFCAYLLNPGDFAEIFGECLFLFLESKVKVPFAALVFQTLQPWFFKL